MPAKRKPPRAETKKTTSGSRRAPAKKPAPAKAERDAKTARGRTAKGRPPRPAKGAAPSPDDRRKEILKAAVKVFAERGYHGCRISDVADEAGVAYGLVYHYFGNKDALLKSVFDTNWAVFLKAVDAIAEAELPTREKLRQTIDFLINAYEVTPLIVKVFIQEFGRSSRLGDTLETPEMTHVFKVLARILWEAHDKKELRPGIDPRSGAVIFLGALESALASFVLPVHGAVHDDGPDIEKARKTLHTILIDGFLR